MQTLNFIFKYVLICIKVLVYLHHFPFVYNCPETGGGALSIILQIVISLASMPHPASLHHNIYLIIRLHFKYHLLQ